MLGIILGAGILGIIIAVMEGGEFPGWGKMIVCVLAAAIPSAVMRVILPPDLFFIGTIVGAICAMGAIMATCGMGVTRSAIAAGSTWRFSSSSLLCCTQFFNERSTPLNRRSQPRTPTGWKALSAHRLNIFALRFFTSGHTGS
jgi:hypothetical protein